MDTTESSFVNKVALCFCKITVPDHSLKANLQSCLVLQSCSARWKMPDQRALKNPYLDYNGPESTQDLFDSQGRVSYTCLHK